MSHVPCGVPGSINDAVTRRTFHPLDSPGRQVRSGGGTRTVGSLAFTSSPISMPTPLYSPATPPMPNIDDHVTVKEAKWVRTHPYRPGERGGERAILGLKWVNVSQSAERGVHDVEASPQRAPHHARDPQDARDRGQEGKPTIPI